MESAKPFEITEFSGGLTENILDADPRRFAAADNMFVVVDKNLEERPGFIAHSSTGYYIPSAQGQRINGYYSVINETILLPQSGRNFFAQDNSGIWQKITGVNGGEILSGGDNNSQTTIAEFQRQVYVTSDGVLGQNGILPSKLYRNTSNAWTAKTAGLPRAYTPPNMNDTQLLGLCITNANALRTSMIAHIQDAQNTTYAAPIAYQVTPGKLHINVDNRALCYFQSVTFGLDTNVPGPLPTPAPAATSEATMYALVAALNAAYTAHFGDAMINSFGTNPFSTTIRPQTHPLYHQDMPVFDYIVLGQSGGSIVGNAVSLSGFPTYLTKGPGAPLQNNATPTSHTQAATMLDDLWQKWNFHILSVNTHDQQNVYGNINKYRPVGTKIGNIYLTNTWATITPNWQDIVNYGNNLQYIFNSHVSNTLLNGGHKQVTNPLNNMYLYCTLPSCTDLDSFYLMVYWLRSLYQMHNYDAVMGNISVGILSTLNTAGTSTLLNVVLSSDGTTIVTAQGSLFYHSSGGLSSLPVVRGVFDADFFQIINGCKDGLGRYTLAATTVAGSGSLTLDRTLKSSGAYQGQVSPSQYHGSYNYVNSSTGYQFKDASQSVEISTASLSNSATTVGTDLPSWLLLANDVFFALGNHMQNSAAHTGIPGVIYSTLVNSVPNLNFFIPSYTSVSYAYFFSDSYTVEPNGIQYLTQGNPVISASTQVPVSFPLGTTPINLYPAFYTAGPTFTQYGTQLTNLPVLTNDATTEYDLTNVKLNIYRTTNGGTTYYLLTQVANGTTSYLDVTNDTIANPGSTSLSVNQSIYTSAGVVGSDQPPICKFTHILNGTVYWGAITDTGQYFPQRIRQSVQFSPDSAPASFFDDLDDVLVGLSSTHNNLLAFCKNTVYRMAGGFNAQGQGALTHTNISDTLGCLNAKSIVRTELGVFFAGFDGFYYTDGYQLINITLELKNTYKALTASDAQKRSIYGAYDKATRRVHWAMKTSSNDSDNSVVYTFYLDYGIKPSGTFTLIKNGSNFRPSSLVFQAGVMYYAHEKGYLLKWDQSTKWDQTVGSGAPSTWATQAIPYNFLSTAFSLGTSFSRKYVTKLHLTGVNVGNSSIQPYAIKDQNQYGTGAQPFAPINYVANITWGTPTIVWSDSSIVWAPDGKFDVWRRFPAGSLRCDFMQVQLKPAYACIYSTSVGFPSGAIASVNKAAKTCTILTPSGYSSIIWPADVVGYYATFATDGYVLQFLITALDVTKKILTLTDTAGNLVNSAGVKWQIMGYKKEQRINLNNLIVHFAYLGNKNQKYSGPYSTSGPGNAGGNPP